MTASGGYALYIDIGALRDRHYTGIPRVVFEIARHWYGQSDVACNLMIDNAIVPPHVCDMLLAEGQAVDWPDRFRELSEPLSVHEALAADPGPSIGLFPTHRKTTDAPFTKAVQIIHDLTTLLVPETHAEAMLRSEATVLDREVAAADHIVSVSDATRQHLMTYLAVEPERITTIQLGVDPPQAVLDELADHGLGTRLEPFALVLGTVELRKNLTLVLRHLRHRRELMADRRWLFTGQIRHDVFEALKPELLSLEPELRAGRIAFLGYVPEAAKHLLLCKADFAVYPSMFEGFGLPVAEALWHGCPVACSLSTSLPEVAREAGFYFDPSSEDELEGALAVLIASLRQDREGLRRRSRRVGRSYTWQRFNAALGGLFARLVAAPRPPGRLLEAGPCSLQSPNRLQPDPGAWAATGIVIETAETTRGPEPLILHETATDSLHIVSQCVEGPGRGCWSAALDVRPLVRRRVVIQIDNEHEHAVQACFDLRQGVVVPGSAAASGEGQLGAAFMEPLPGGWWRCAVTGSPNVGTARVRMLVYLVEGEDGCVHFPGQKRAAAVIRRPQLELASYPTPYRASSRGRAESRPEGSAVGLPADVQGACLGIVAGGLVRGWAWRRSEPLERLTVELHQDGRRVATARAQEFRPELLALGKGDGCYGFSLVLPSRGAGPMRVSVEVAGEPDAAIAGGQLVVDDSDLQAPASVPDRCTLTDIRFEETHRRWTVTGTLDRLARDGTDPQLELRIGSRVLGCVAASLPDPDRPDAASFVISIAAADLPAGTAAVDILEAGTGVPLRHGPFHIVNAAADRPSTVEDVLAARRPTVDTILRAMPGAATPANAERVLAVAYKLCLGRPPDATGLATYTAKLVGGEVTPRDLVLLLLSSPEATQGFSARPILPPWL